MTKRLRVLLLATLTLFSLFIISQLCNAWWLRFSIGQQTDGSRGVDVEVGNESGGTFRTQVICDFCHIADSKLKASLAKPYDIPSQSNHEQKYFRAKTLQTQGLTKYALDKDLYLAMEKGRLVLVNGRENYKLTFAEDVVVLLDGHNRPAFIHGIKDFIKTKISPTPIPQKK